MKKIEERAMDFLREYSDLCVKHKVIFFCNSDATETCFRSISDNGEILIYSDVIKLDDFIDGLKFKYK